MVKASKPTLINKITRLDDSLILAGEDTSGIEPINIDMSDFQMVSYEDVLKNRIKELRTKLNIAIQTDTKFEHLDMMLLNHYETKLNEINNKNILRTDWIIITKDEYETYPNEGEDVLVTDGNIYDVASFIMSGEYKWVKVDIARDTMNDFNAFIPIKWKYIK